MGRVGKRAMTNLATEPSKPRTRARLATQLNSVVCSAYIASPSMDHDHGPLLPGMLPISWSFGSKLARQHLPRTREISL